MFVNSLGVCFRHGECFSIHFLKNKDIFLHNHNIIMQFRTLILIEYYYLINGLYVNFAYCPTNIIFKINKLLKFFFLVQDLVLDQMLNLLCLSSQSPLIWNSFSIVLWLSWPQYFLRLGPFILYCRISYDLDIWCFLVIKFHLSVFTGIPYNWYCILPSK